MGVACKQCGTRDVEPERECYATPVCFVCLPPPRPLPKVYTQSHVDDLTRERDEARAALDEREADMHSRIRADYDKTVADCWRAKVAEVERERDEALCRLDHAEADAEQAVSITISERDEARAEVERLQGAFVASVDRWMEFVSHFQRLVRSNMGTEAGKLAIGYFKRAAEAGDLDEAGPPTITPRDAASERAAIVAMLHNEAFRLSAQADVTDDGYDANTMDDQARALRAAAERIERGKGDV